VIGVVRAASRIPLAGVARRSSVRVGIAAYLLAAPLLAPAATGDLLPLSRRALRPPP